MSEPDPDADAVEAPANDLVPAPDNRFSAFVVGKDTVGFEHLNGFHFTFDTAERKGVWCFVEFSTHCFSDRYDPERHAHNVVVIDERGQPRCFDQDRYDLSKGLEDLIRGLPGSRVYQTPEANFAIVTTRTGREYRVFFNVRRMQKSKLRLYVESAYAPDAGRFKVAPTTAYQKVRFAVLVDRVLGGKPVKFNGR